MDVYLKAIAASFVRHGLTMLGTWLVAHGLMSQSDVAANAEGATLILIGLIWAWWQKRTTVGPAPNSLVNVATTAEPGTSVDAVKTMQDAANAA